jgi:hypothetical protein
MPSLAASVFRVQRLRGQLLAGQRKMLSTVAIKSIDQRALVTTDYDIRHIDVVKGGEI